MNKVKLLFLIFLLLVRRDCSAQVSFGFDSLLIQKFDFEVKQISEFFDRFNFKEPVKFSDDVKPTRAKNLVSILNLRDSTLVHDPATVGFLKFVCADTNNIFLNYEDDIWFAFVNTSFVYHGKNITIEIVLKPEGSKKHGYKWVITDVKGSLFSFPAKEKMATVFINPANHEIDFSELSKAFNRRADISLYTTDSYHPDPLSAFILMVQNGDLKFDQINNTYFQFLQVPDWIFTVRNFNRGDYNSGWLIASLRKMSNTQKKNYINNHFVN